MSKKTFTYLALGDSYTIGESVPLYESFPYQTIQLLRKEGLHFHAAEIVAKTGWTSFELMNNINHIKLNEPYDFVSLLIGVNNQYRGLSVEDFKKDFELLLKKAIHLANNNINRVIVLSIPDWGVTPFAKDRDITTISKEIDMFNAACASIAAEYKTQFINITESTRRAKEDTTLLTNDHLHYSGKEMSEWSGWVAEIIKKKLI